jgi:hypothetical protein
MAKRSPRWRKPLRQLFPAPQIVLASRLGGKFNGQHLATDLSITTTPVDQYPCSFVYALPRGSDANGRHVGEEPRDSRPRQATGHEHQPGTPVAVGPVLQLDRRVRNVLHEMNHDRPATFLDRDQALDAKEIGSAHRRQNRIVLLEGRP